MSDTPTRSGALLENWHIVYADSENMDVRLTGDIYGDLQGRFENGAKIITSSVRTLNLEARIAVTRNSTYVLGKGT